MEFLQLKPWGLMLFAFSPYDADDSGELEMDELHKLLEMFMVNGLKENQESHY